MGAAVMVAGKVAGNAMATVAVEKAVAKARTQAKVKGVVSPKLFTLLTESSSQISSDWP